MMLFYYLHGVSSYQYDVKDEHSIVKITNCVDGFDYYVMHYYNFEITSGGKESSVDMLILIGLLNYKLMNY